MLLALLPLKQTAGLTGLHWHTLKSTDKARLLADLIQKAQQGTSLNEQKLRNGELDYDLALQCGQRRILEGAGKKQADLNVANAEECRAC